MAVKSQPSIGDIKISSIFISTYVSDIGSNEPFKMNIDDLVREIQIYEDIKLQTLSGVMVIEDAAGLLDRLPLTGNEVLEFTAHTPGFALDDSDYPRGYDFTMESGSPMFIYKIKDIRVVSPNKKFYGLEFCSKEKIKDTQRKICKAMTGPIHNLVMSILRNDLKSKKDLFFEETKPVVKYVIPKKSPLNTIKFLNTESISKDFNNSGFYFFETSDGFHFKSLASMISHESGVAKRPEIEYTNAPKIESGTLYKQKDKNGYMIKGNIEKIFSMKIKTRFDTFTNIKEGVYASRLVTYDAFTKQFKEIDFDYLQDFVERAHISQISKEETNVRHSIMPIYNFEDGKILSDFSEGKYMFTTSAQGMHDKKDEEGNINAIETADISETLQTSLSQKGAFNSFIIELEVPGHTAITAGTVIGFKTLTGSSTKESKIDPYLSGNYLVTGVSHIIQRPKGGRKIIHNMTLECVKDSVSRPYMVNDKDVLNKEKGRGLNVSQSLIDKVGQTR
tara:strand:+ start:961 stop:2475 length:1515 start_codon:yes stop_codon:yes gene_type:complete